MTNEEFEIIAKWISQNGKTWKDFFNSIKLKWNYADFGYWKEDDEEYFLSTAGLYSNEEIIHAMKQNKTFWLMCWEETRRGGHYKFKLR